MPLKKSISFRCKTQIKKLPMKIFAINKRFWNSNHEGWKQWIESEIISYHATEEGANAKISSFDDKDEEITDEYGDLSSVYFISCIEVKE